jgi:ATP-binding cassette, subfamily F, member 3
VCDEFWLVGRGGIAPLDGDLDDYQKYLLEEARRLRDEARTRGKATAAAPAPAAPAPVAEPVRVNAQEQRQLGAQQRQQLATRLRPLKKERDAAEARIAALETEKAQLEGRLATMLTPADIAEAGRRLKSVAEELEQLEERWLALSGEIEAAESATG